MKDNIANIIDKYKDLKPYQQKILECLCDNFSAINEVDVGSIASVGMVCRKCGADNFIKNGTTKGVQRYQCKKCNTTQFHDANTPLYNMKLKSKWADFVYIMLDKEQPLSCIGISEELDIDIKTAYRWRHKLLSSLRKTNTLGISEEAELDEVYFRFSVKGVIGKEKFDYYVAPKHPDNVESQLRLDEKKMSAEKHQTIFMCIHNRTGDFDFIPIKIQKKGIVSEKDLKRIMVDIDLSKKTVITDKEPSMKSYLNKISDTNHLTFKSSDIKKGILKEKNVHNNNINNTMMLLNKWLKNFQGVSTKYIWNYLKWFRFTNLFKLFKIEQMVAFSLSDKKSYSRHKNRFNLYEKFMYI